jgi:hypothetical protein
MNSLSQAMGPLRQRHPCGHDKACACLRPAQAAAALTLPGAGAAAAARSLSAQPRHPPLPLLPERCLGRRAPRDSLLPKAPRHACTHALCGMAKACIPTAGTLYIILIIRLSVCLHTVQLRRQIKGLWRAQACPGRPGPRPGAPHLLPRLGGPERHYGAAQAVQLVRHCSLLHLLPAGPTACSLDAHSAPAWAGAHQTGTVQATPRPAGAQPPGAPLPEARLRGPAASCAPQALRGVCALGQAAPASGATLV